MSHHMVELFGSFMERKPIWVGNAHCCIRLKNIKDRERFIAWARSLRAL